MRKSIVIVIALNLIVSGCSSPRETTAEPKIINVFKKKTPHKSKTKSHYKFNRKKSYPKTFGIFEDPKLLAKANKNNTSILVDISEQRLKLLVKGKIALDTPATTGKKDKLTPLGTFNITEKIEKNKRSNRYGKLLKDGKMVHGGDKLAYKGEYDKFEGAKMHYWMRLTPDGVGIHHSYHVYRFPNTHGCIRLPSLTASKVFKLAKVGTRVNIVK